MQHSRVKSKEDTWKTEELQKHLKTADSERPHDERKRRERWHHRAEDKDELIERIRKHGDKERKEEKGHLKSSERNRHYDRDREMSRDRRTEKEKPRDKDRDRKADKEKYESDRQRMREKDKVREGKYSGEDPGKISRVSKDYREGELTEEKQRKRIDVRESQERTEKNNHRSEDGERRHRDPREKERKARESEDYEERDSRHRKHREDLNDPDRERRRRERKHGEHSEREKRHRSRQEKGGLDSTAIHEPLEHGHTLQKLKDRSPREQALHDGDRAKEHTEKKDKREQQSERRKSDHKGTDKDEASDATYDNSTNYEEDFEDYEDDFEDESDHEEKEPVRIQENLPHSKNPEIEAIQKAMILENENIASFSSTEKIKHDEQELNQTEPPSVSNKGGHRGIFIDFGSAKQKQVTSQIAAKIKKRSMDILRLVDLDFSSTVSLLDLAPVKEYDMYIRNFGKTNTKQAYVQCNEDCVDREIQTEEIDIDEKWTQHPGESAVVCGGSRTEAADSKAPAAQLNSQRLTSFLRSSCQVIAVLLEEDRADRQSEFKLQSKEPCLSISDGCFQLNTNLPFLQGRIVHRLHFSEAQRHLLLSAHGSCNSDGTIIPTIKYIICVWNIWEPTAPQKVLVCESEVKCCCFSPGKAALVFAGTVDGSVIIWDLREDISMHQTIKLGDTSWTFRSATFSTDGVYTNVNHSSPIKAIDPVLSAVNKETGIAALSSQEEVSGFSFQIASLDESGHLILWVVVELRKDDIAVSQNDLGLIPGGKVKLVYSSSILLDGSFFPKDVLSLGTPQTLNVKFLPQDSNHFFVGTDIGIVTHGTRYGLMEPPRHYKPLHGRIRPSHVVAIDFSPFHVPAFLAGCSDGCVRLHMTYAEFPAMQWDQSTNGQAVTAVQWSLTRPSVFFVLDAAGCIYVWDLLQNDLQPVAKEFVSSDQITSMAVFGEPEKTYSLMGLALAKTSGRVEIQYIKKQWAKPQPKEKDKLGLILY